MELGRIQEIYIGRDGQSRTALVRVASRDRQHVVLRRPLQLLYPLEIPGEEYRANTKDATPSATVEPSVEVEQRDGLATEAPKRYPVRAAAKKANERVRVWTQELQN